MRFYLFLRLICIFLICLEAEAQETYILQGKVFDQSNQEGLVGVNVFLSETQSGTNTDIKGEFRLTTTKQKFTIQISYLGYRDTTLVIDLLKNSKIALFLVPESKVLTEIVVESLRDSPDSKVNQMQMSTDRITMEEAKMLPAIFGEVDIIKILQLKPGVKSGGEGNAGFFVRGGSSDQNLILVEHAPVYNPNHLFGLFSVFNSDAVKDVTLYKAGFPAQYGGRLSSVLDVNMRQGDPQKWGVEGGLGLISSRLTLNAPIQKGKSSLLISGRRTYIDLFTNLANKLNENNEKFDPIPAYYFYDVNASLNFQLGKKDELKLTGYLGNDFFKFEGDNFGANLLWGNRSATLEWTHRFSRKLKMQQSYFTAGYLYRINNRFGENSITLGSNIWDQGLVSDWTFSPDENHLLKWGASGIYHRFSVGEFGISTDFTDIQAGQKLEGLELGLYASHEWQIDENIELLTGLRSSFFISKNKTYTGIEPRLALKYALSPSTTLKASYARMYQYLHLVSSSASSLPTDVWYPSTEGVKPQYSDQIALGLHKSLAEDQYFFSLEGYYKWISNAIDFKDGAQLFANPRLEDEFVFGRGWAYGAEVYVEKKTGRTRGWVGYTLAWTWRQFDEINGGKALHPRYDRRHDISFVVIHQLSKRVSISATWVYGTGNFTSIAGGRFGFQDFLPNDPVAIPEFLGRNDYQMPASHRLDLGLVWKLKPKHGTADLTFSIYNAYSRRNPYFIYYKEGRNEEDQVVSFTPTLVSLFPILPSVTYNFKF
jgi:hypothetical protein